MFRLVALSALVASAAAFAPVNTPARAQTSLGYTIKLISGLGELQGDPTEQLEIYIGSERPIWTNKGDTATLMSPDGRVVDFREHKPKGSK